MGKSAKLYLIILFLFLLQIAFCLHYRSFVTPDFLLIIIISTSFLGGKNRGIIYGFFTGLLQDLFIGGIPGIYMVVKSFVGGLCDIIEKLFFKKNLIIPPFMVFVLTIFHEYVALFMSRGIINIFIFIDIILVQAVVNTVFGIIIYYILYRWKFSGDINYE